MSSSLPRPVPHPPPPALPFDDSTPPSPSPRPRPPAPSTVAAAAAAPSFFPSHPLDQAFAGLTAGIISTLCMQPLDLLKVRLQVRLSSPSASVASSSGAGAGSGSALGVLRDIVKEEGGIRRGLYRGLTPNLVGNASSWGLYFLWYSMLKDRAERSALTSAAAARGGAAGTGTASKLGAGQHLLASAQAGVLTAIMTNPLWVVKTRMFTTSVKQEMAYKGVLDGLYQITTREGLRGLSKGMLLALFGVSNGAIQFMSYEELKRWRQEVKRRKVGTGTGRGEEDWKALTNTEYILMSGSAKLVAIGLTYPYQVIRSRIQYQPLPPIPPYTSIPSTIQRTFATEGLRGFYKGLATNAVRILPGTCVTFVVYEQVSRALERAARAKLDRGEGGRSKGG